MVAGDICENPLDPKAGVQLPGAELLAKSNGFVDP
jgi:hypothetical protein